ncbi:MAG: hypothetical protein KAI08_03150 [Bacteroidales bacterium]|nr:hypothetical protein [Bacteroidales bacterium]
MANPINRIKSQVSRNLLNIPGWRTGRKLVIIESDDWGSIRMPSSEVYEKFISRGFDIAGSDYNRIDTLESNDDLEMLFEVLQSHKDSAGNSPLITANCVMGNPDFKRIRQSDFSTYYVEPVTETLKHYPQRDRVEELWKQGDSAGIFHPQFHGREHVNVVRWMEALREKTEGMMFTFDHETTFSGDGDYNFMEVLDYNSPEDLKEMKEGLTEGLDLFEKVFGYRSLSFIPPCYTWNSEVEETLHEGGVRYIQGLVKQLIPTGSFGNYNSKLHFLGNKNAFGQYFLIRNAFFEPSLTKLSDPVGEVLNRIQIAFRWNKPAVIGSHRINFMGSLDEQNRKKNLQLLDDLLKAIIKLWPHVEFISSDELGNLIAGRGDQ